MLVSRRAIVAAVAIIASASGSYAQTPSVKMVLDFAIQGQQSPFILANEGGYFDKLGVKVQIDRGYGSADTITKVAAGAYDIGFADLGAVVQFNAKQGGSKIISVFQVYDISPMSLVSLKKSNIKTPADLVGKKIASPASTSVRLMFPLFAAANNIDASKVEWVDVTPQLREALLAQGRADASAAQSVEAVGLGRLGIADGDISVMRFSDHGVNIYGHGLIATPEYAQKNPEVIRKVIAGVAAGYRAAAADPDKAIAAMKKGDPLIDAVTERGRLDVILKDAVMTDYVKKNGFGLVDPVRMKKTVDAVTDAFKVPSIDPSLVYTNQYLPPAADLKAQ